MARYITASHIVKKLLSVSITDDLYGMGIKTGIDQALKFIEETPTAEVAEVKRGEWKSSVMNTGAPHCSLCNGVALSRHTYCPHCGAKMDGGGRK